jgi:hypothetical protein
MGGLTACASQQEVSPNFGHCYRTAFSSQVINPDAPDDRTPADELTGTLAAQIYNERYVKSMLKEDDDEEESVSEQLE